VKKQLFDFAKNTLKNSFMSEQDNERSKHAETIIRNHVLWSMGAGFIPVVIADVFAVSALQLDMIRQLARVYNIDFSETQGKAIVTSLTSATLARIAAGSVVKLIPVVGSLVGGISNSIFAGASTYALGEVFKRHFDTGGTFLDFDVSRLSKIYNEKFEKGKKVAEQWKKEETIRKKTTEESKEAPEEVESAPVADKPAAQPNGQEILAKLKELADMRDSGILSEEEFATMKTKLIGMFG
jgi:uncharacterized protein (DUF697 family)